MIDSKNKKLNIIFYILILLLIYSIFMTNPFLKYPFDVYVHLDRIEKQYNTNHLLHNRLFWHYIWAKIFHLFNIDNTQIFFRAYVIHYTQVLISFSGVFYFSYIFIKNIFKQIDKLYIKYLALWSTIIWFTIYATNSMGIHQVWILWYSINYQITLIFILVMLGLTISILYNNFNIYNKFIYIFIIIILAFIVLKIHTMELLYYLMYLSTLSLVYIDKIFIYIKKNIYNGLIAIITIGLFVYNLPILVNHFESKSSRIINYLSYDKIPQLYNQIMRDGYSLIRGLNRAYASMNELIYLSIILIILLGIINIYNYIKKRDSFVRYRLLFFLIITSLFVLIPLFQFSSGLAGMLVSSVYVVNRFYYSSLIFLVIPIFTYYILQVINKKNIIYLNIYILFILFSIFLYSKYDINHNQNYYKNIQSIKNSFYREKVGFSLSSKNIKEIGKLKEKYKHDLNISKPYFFAREDIAFVLKHIYKEKVYLLHHYNGRKLNTNFYIVSYNKNKNKILFKVPINFPKYEPYK